MGLDVSAYSKIISTEGGGIWIEAGDGWHDYESGEYDASEESAYHSFRAGSYSSYNRWRRDLCWSMLGVEPDVVWSTPEAFEGRPFVELINFSDCQGAIGGEFARKLHQDFVDNESKFKHWTMQTYLKEGDLENEGDLWWDEVYDDFMMALEIAAQDGVLIFH